MQIAIVKYNGGNSTSVANALQRLGVSPLITDDATAISQADKVIFPGVGQASVAMTYLRERGLDQLLTQLQQPVLGICLGMQLLGNHSEENDTPTLGLLPQPVKRFAEAGLKVPHMGWNQVAPLNDHPLFFGLGADPYFYFVHSYYMPVHAQTVATCTYGAPFSAAVQMGNVAGVQFHPEKSGEAGHRLLQNFLTL